MRPSLPIAGASATRSVVSYVWCSISQEVGVKRCLIKRYPGPRSVRAGGSAARGGVNSVEVAGGLLRLLSELGGPMWLPVALVARRRHALRQGAPAHPASLARAGVVEQDVETARYDLGPLMLRAGLGRSAGPTR